MERWAGTYRVHVHRNGLGELDDGRVRGLGLADDALRARVLEEEAVVDRGEPRLGCKTRKQRARAPISVRVHAGEDSESAARTRRAGRADREAERRRRRRGVRTAVDASELLLADEDVQAAVVVPCTARYVRRDVVLLSTTCTRERAKIHTHERTHGFRCKSAECFERRC